MLCVFYTHHGAHCVLSDAEVEVATSEGFSLDLGVAEVVASVDVVLVGAVEICGSGHVLGDKLGNVLEDLRAWNEGVERALAAVSMQQMGMPAVRCAIEG